MRNVNTRMSVVIEIVTVVAIVAVVSLAFWFVRERYWWRVENARVVSEGRELKESRVYTHESGDLLVFLRDGQVKKGIYLIRLKSCDVENPNSNDFYLFSSFLLSRFAPLSGVSMNSAKSDVPPMLEVKDKEVSFTALSGQRIYVYF